MSSSGNLKFDLRGLDSIRAELRKLSVQMEDKIMAVALKRAAKPLVDSAKSYAKRSVRTGALKRSIGAIVKKGKRGGAPYALVGPIRGYYRNGKKLKKGADRRGADDPANYAHLVEGGHFVVAPIKGTSRRKNTAAPAKTKKTWVAPRPFMRPALLQSQPDIANEMATALREGIDAATGK